MKEVIKEIDKLKVINTGIDRTKKKDYDKED